MSEVKLRTRYFGTITLPAMPTPKELRDKFSEINSTLHALQAENESIKQQLANEKYNVSATNEVALQEIQRLRSALDDADNKLRQMRVDGEITMREMIVALKPLMWISEALNGDRDE